VSQSIFSCLNVTSILTVDAPRWGVQTRLGWAIRAFRFSLGGSEVKTSRAAPATLPDCQEEKEEKRDQK
jgi:hypothetical protein